MSKPNLPPLPPEVATVRALFRGQPDHFEALDYYYTQDQMRAYAEEAVRQALAAQETAAWLREVTPGGGVWRHYVSLEEPISGFPAIERKHRLAIIPDDSPGHKPAPVDTSPGHSALPPLTGCSPGDFSYNAEVVTVDEAKAYATEFARTALDAAAKKIGELGQKAFEQPGVPGAVHMAYHQALVILLTHKPETRDG